MLSNTSLVVAGPEKVSPISFNEGFLLTKSYKPISSSSDLDKGNLLFGPVAALSNCKASPFSCPACMLRINLLYSPYSPKSKARSSNSLGS